MQAKIVDKFTQKNYDKISAPLDLDLQEYFKILQSEVEDLANNSDGMTEDELNKAISELIGG